MNRAVSKKRYVKNKYVIKLAKPLPSGTNFHGGTRLIKDKFLDESGGFSKLFTKKLYLFDSKREAKQYATDLYIWGELHPYVEYVKIKVKVSEELIL